MRLALVFLAGDLRFLAVPGCFWLLLGLPFFGLPFLDVLRLAGTGFSPPKSTLGLRDLIFNEKAGSIRSNKCEPQLTGSHYHE